MLLRQTPHDRLQVPAPWLSLCQNRVPIQEQVQGFQHRELQYSVLLISFPLLFHQDRLAGFFRFVPIHFSLEIVSKVQSKFSVVGFLGPRKVPNSFLVLSKFNIVGKDIFS